VGCQKSMVLVPSGSGRPCEGLRCAVVSLPSSAGVPVVWSFLYLALRHVLELIVLCCRSTEAKEIEILVLRHELRFCVATIHGPGCSPRIASCLQR
jgi:hypothetical protein